MRNPADFALFRASENEKIHELADILDNSPQLPAEAMLPFLAATTIGDNLHAAEAFKATYLGMKPWVAAELLREGQEREEARRKAEEPKPSRYEKTGKVEPVGAKIVDAGERARIQAARDAAAAE